ncbi:non-ribosomal peptide synthetase [Winogradskyella costae]|uniref:non-ribosomal peptide synthetase n=1 Tax=Winogradskyella costae TaxID=2697008 RepID=UPI0015C6B25D|nr:non-ribosomal peptide synthetase [Winogradskyella costae]
MEETNISNTTTNFNPFSGPEIEKVIYTTPSQVEIWFACELGGDDANMSYNESVSLILNGRLKDEVLKDAVQNLVSRHEALRSVFSTDGQFMTIFKNLPIEIETQDLSKLSQLEKKASIKANVTANANTVFDLVKGPLFRVGLIKCSETEHHLVLTAHHIICDGWSVGVMLDELGSFYSATMNGKTPNVATPVSFSAYAEEEDGFIGSKEYKETEQYWLKQYEASIPIVSLPTDFPRPKIRTFKSNRLDFGFDYDLVSDLKKVGIKSGASFVVTLLSAFEVFLYHQTGQDDLVVGLPAAGQSQTGKIQLIGHCVNLLPLRSKLASDMPFNTYLKNRKNRFFDDYDHQRFGFGQLLQKLNIARDLSRVPLVPVVFNIDMGKTNNVAFEGLNYKLKSNPRSFENFELALNASGTENELVLQWSYNAALFTSTRIEQMMTSFKELLYGIVANPNIEIGKIIKEDNSAAAKLNDTNVFLSNSIIDKSCVLDDEDYQNYTKEKSIVDLFLSQVKKTPNNIAVAFGSKKITYKELDSLSNQFSNYLIDFHGVKIDDLISVMIERSEWIIVVAIGILKSGAAYVPIEPKYPEKRKRYIIDDSECKIVIDNQFITDFINKLDELSPKLNDSVKTLPESRCYVIYTSGTTGNPKGVMVEHRNVVSLLYNGKNLFKFNENDVWCMFHSFCFDFSVWEMYGPLFFGGKLIIVPEVTAKDPFEFISMIEKEGITVLNQTPSAFINLVESTNSLDLSLNLRYIIFGGEALFPKHLKTWYNKYPNIKFINMYGITETTVHVTFKEIDQFAIDSNISTIGNCIPTLTAYILDEYKNPQPVGVVGELYVAGKGVARGYLNRPELTKERFLPDIFKKDERMYRSGDLAKWLPNGEIEFIGRNDDQVKIRGHRIEIREVEAALRSLSNIKQSVVVTSNHLAGELSLVAYIQPIDTEDNLNIVRDQLKEILPEFQIPSTFMWVENFPLTTNGKIDKTKLPSPEYVRTDSNSDLNIAQTQLEKDIANIWSELLQIPVIDVRDNFFEMGGSSLIAQRVIGALRKKLNIKIPLIKIFQYPTISQLAESLSENLQVEEKSETIADTVNAKVTASINKLNPQEVHTNVVHKKKTELVIKTTKAQSEILTDCIFGGDDAKRAYNISVSLKFAGKLKYDALERAVQSLVERHESLRSSFSEDLNTMQIYTDFHVDILYHDISKQEESEKEMSISSFINDDINYLCDLVNGPLLKFNLVKTNEHEHELLLLVNHAICDGLSTSVLLEELSVLYTAFAQGKIPRLNEPDHFSSFADKENKFVESDAFKDSEEFWINMYKESIPKVELPIDYPRPKLRSYNSNYLDCVIDNSLLNSLKQIGNSPESGMFTSIVTTLISAFEVFLYQQTGQNDLVLGLISSTRANYDMMQMVGHSVNLLPLRSKLDAKINFNDYLTQRNTQLFDAYDNQSISFGHLLEKISIPRDSSRIPLVPVIINIQLGDVLENKDRFYDLSTEIKHNENRYRTFEIELQIFMSSQGPCFRWRYNTTLFKPETIEQMMASFKEVLNEIVANPSIKIGNIIEVDPSVYSELNDTTTSYPQQPLHELISKQAQITPFKTALKFESSEITYREFEKQVNQLAHALGEQGVKSGTVIAVALPRSIELVVSLAAIMQCGAAYLPLDPSYPQQRLDFMMKDSEAAVFISSNKNILNIETSATVLVMEDLFNDLSKFPSTPQNFPVGVDDMAYLLYTSGSTGNPKGVQVTHKNLVNFLYSMLDKPGIEETDKLLSITTISFDIAGLELYLPLLKGATLVIANDETAKDTRLMLELLDDEDISILQATPTTWQMLIDIGWEKRLPIKALSGGEVLPLSLATKLLDRVDELWNMYGPTETTIWSAIKQIKKEEGLITIGKPIANTQLYIVNDTGQLMAPGKIGELCIAGDGVAKGYWNRRDLTSEKFINNPYNIEADTLLYRTGDLAKLLPTGEVQCLGRIDQQVKIRGHRIELGEIEEAINKLDKVESSVVLVNENLLEAHIIFSNSEEVSDKVISKWKMFLSEQLPTHMIPHNFYFLKEFPTTLNGKIDRNALKSKVPKKTNITEYTAPRTETEKIVASIWQDCLNLEKIDIYSDFFELGGHSLIAVKVMSLLEKKTGKRLPLSALMIYPTINKLAEFIAVDYKEILLKSLVSVKPNGNKTPLYVVHGAEHNVLFLNALVKNIDENQPLYGLQSKGLNGSDIPHDKVHDMAAYYISEIIKTNPKGPYALAGYSFGGVIAFEMARLLMSNNKEVKKVVLLDSYIYPHYYSSNPRAKKMAKIKYKIGMAIFMTKTMLSSKAKFNRRIQLCKNAIKNNYLKIKLGKENQHNLINSWPYQLDQMHNKAVNNYQILPLDIKVDLLRVTEDDIFYAHDTDLLGWGPIAKGGVNRHDIPGNHRNMLSPPNDKKLGRILQNLLDS